MKILITGGGGMVGRNILESSNVKAYRIISPSSKELNLLNRNAVYEFILKEMPDFIIHAAGRVGGIQANMANPKAFLSDNLNMGINVISAAETVGVPNLMNLASSCMYPKGVSNPLSEKMILKGEMEPTNEGYALAKAVCTRLCEHIARENPEKNIKP